MKIVLVMIFSLTFLSQVKADLFDTKIVRDGSGLVIAGSVAEAVILRRLYNAAKDEGLFVQRIKNVERFKYWYYQGVQKGDTIQGIGDKNGGQAMSPQERAKSPLPTFKEPHPADILAREAFATGYTDRLRFVDEGSSLADKMKADHTKLQAKIRRLKAAGAIGIVPVIVGGMIYLHGIFESEEEPWLVFRAIGVP